MILLKMGVLVKINAKLAADGFLKTINTVPKLIKIKV